MSLLFVSSEKEYIDKCMWTKFAIHDEYIKDYDVTKLHSISEFGYCFVVHIFDAHDVIEGLLKDTPLNKDDFEIHYTYDGYYLIVTKKQAELKGNLDIIKENIKLSNWGHIISIYIPE